MTTVFHLLRHASHGHLGRILTGRHPGVPLSEVGCKEARALGRHVAQLGLDMLYASPQLRARQTAEIIAGQAGLEYGTAAELDEIDFGCWSGMTFEVLAQDVNWRRWNLERNLAPTPAGDTMAAVAERFAALIDQLRSDHAGGAVGLVSHSDVIKAGLCHYLGWPFSAVHDFEIGPASLTTLVFDRGGAILRALDQRLGPVQAEAAA